jgi:hypothetical protein
MSTEENSDKEIEHLPDGGVVEDHGSSWKESGLFPAARQWLGAPLAERVQFVIKDRLILYPALESVISTAEWMILEPRQERARGLIVCAAKGNGKTSLSKLIHGRFSAHEHVDLPCVLRISMSGVRDARSVYGRIMEGLGSPARISHRLSDRELLVQRLLKDVNCRLLLLDEVQDIILGSEREQIRALEGIKLLMNEVRLPILAFGAEKAGQAFNSDGHLAARFTQFTMPSWQADSTLASFVATYERCLPFEEPSNLSAPANLSYLAKVGGGVIGNIVNRIKNAALTALVEGSSRITTDILKRAESRPAMCPLTRRNDSP